MHSLKPKPPYMTKQNLPFSRERFKPAIPIKKPRKLLAFALSLLLTVFGSLHASAHAVQVGYVVLSNGFIRVYIEHWHDDQSSASLVNNGMSIQTTYGTTTITQNTNPTGAFNNTPLSSLPGGNIIILSAAAGEANRYNDWAYYDFAPAVCGVPVKIVLLGGLTVVLEKSASHIWPQTITGTFIDNAGPTITPANTTSNVACGSTGTTVNFSATAVDNCTPNPTVTFDIQPGSFFPVGTTTVTATSTDGNGNTSYQSFPVTVSVVDNTKPEISCPASISVGNDAGRCGAVVTYDLPAFSDNCGSASIQQLAGLPSGSFFPIGTITNTFKVTDPSNNSITCSFTVTVTDSEPPVALCKSFSVALNENLSASITASDINNGSKDNCSPVTIRILSGKTSYNCDDVGKTYDVTIEVTDAKGLASTCIAKVTITDPNSYCNVAPVAVCKSLIVSANDNCQGLSSAEDFDGGSSDADGDNMTFTVAPAGPYAIGTTTVTLTVTDPDGASSTCTTTITVVDDKNPTITAPRPVTVHTSDDGRGNCSTTALLGTPVTADNCKVASVVATVDGAVINPDTHEFTKEETTVTWTVTDAAGNSASATQVVTVVDDEVPTITCTPVLNFCFGEPQTIPDPVFGDNCEVTVSSTRSDNQPMNAPYLPGSTTITWTVTDAAGNQASCQTIVNVNQEITVSIANVKALEYPGIDQNTVYLGYTPASSVTLAATAVGGDENYQYSWSPVSGSNSSIVVSPTTPGENVFSVRVNDGFDDGRCSAEQTITLVVKDARCGSDNTKVNMCHVANSNDPTHVKTICIDGGSVLDHLKKGCRLNDCLNEGTITTGEATEVMSTGFALKAMPNPSTSYFTLKVETSNLSDRVVLRVMDIKGRLVEMKQNIQPNQTLRIGDQYRPGIYFIEVMQGAERTQTKIIKMSN